VDGRAKKLKLLEPESGIRPTVIRRSLPHQRIQPSSSKEIDLTQLLFRAIRIVKAAKGKGMFKVRDRFRRPPPEQSPPPALRRRY